MSQESRFTLERSKSSRAKETCVMICDVVTTVLLGILLAVKAFIKLFITHKKDIRGKLALVTGGGNGLGRGICMKLADHGCNIAVVDIDLKSAEQTADEIRSRGLKAKAYRVDVTKAEEIKKLRDDLCNDLGPVDILVNNAGLMSNRNMEESSEYMELMIKVNILGPMLMTKYFLEQMKTTRSGHIVCISSMSGVHATPFGAPYSATKFGVRGFMESLTEHLRLEKLRSIIRTTCIYPYYIKTRQDVTDFLHPDIRFPPIEVDLAAHEVVQAILREDMNVTIPSTLKLFVKFVDVFPLSIRELIRDRCVREYAFKDPSCKLNFGND